MNAYKKVAPHHISFVEAVTRYGDNWTLHQSIPLATQTAEVTRDFREAIRMRLMEEGNMPRVLDVADPSDSDICTDYWPKPIPTNRHDWTAYRAGYDGAPDAGWPSNCIGTGRTKYEAIAELLELEEV